MGIPSYFAQLIRRHKLIIKAYKKEKATNFCLDSNSIVYDVVHATPFCDGFEDVVIKAVCEKINNYIQTVAPSRVFVAFDGVPPMAKMEQQRKRRYLNANRGSPWDTVQITPGTKFMAKLNKGLKAYFGDAYAARFAFFRLSTSEDPGEGEHKLFDWIRNERPDGDTFVYGLDSDLIILSLQNLPHTKSIHLLREASDFSKSTGLQLLNISALAVQIEALVGVGRISDYVFLVFFLGNDFMPHFPALNLRTKGLDVLLKTYNEQIGKNEKMVDGVEINWKLVRNLIRGLAARENADIALEYAERSAKTVENDERNYPMLHRELETFINPPSPGWEERYYSRLLKVEQQNIHFVCQDFFEILEWNAQYYFAGCSNWTVHYPHAYPPLLKDLHKHFYVKRDINPGAPKTEQELLEYVLPASAAHYASVEYAGKELRPEKLWAFCTFDWEAHLLF